ncbi:MAG: bifunctional phosphopantothenoylcysteine decarboxylase/phosphopantothenate--cysteine ligase CoaBC [Thermoplasmata archaeon]|nr:bifunctional phosphopantothenoylcysteine decarboxylase/phosphopantothenate--cysteine ligase CoaBC [Thermoplasmata archaeon]
MHPSRAIRGNRSQLLAGRRVVLGVTGSIAAIESPRIARELIRHGADVHAVMSPDALGIVTAEALRFATGHAPILQLSGDVEHVSLLGPGEGQADILLIAPATANTLSKIAHGIDDTPVTSCASVALGGGVPILVAPAMHAHMGQNPALRENLARLRTWGVGIVGPTLTEGEEKVASPEEVAAAVLHRLARGPLAARHVLVIGGPSREPIDAVRSVSNESSGATAVALATQAFFRGAEVSLWAGRLQVPVPSYLPVRQWSGVGDLLKLVRAQTRELASSDLVLVPAALSDYTLAPQPGKISSRTQPELQLTLVRAPKVLPEIRRRAPRPSILVGFKLEAGQSADELAAAARHLLQESDLDFVVANDRAVVGTGATAVIVQSRQGTRHWLTGPKSDVAGKLLDDLAGQLALLGPRHDASPPTADRGRHQRRPRSGRRGRSRRTERAPPAPRR